jgi:hypothetical protein
MGASATTGFLIKITAMFYIYNYQQFEDPRLSITKGINISFTLEGGGWGAGSQVSLSLNVFVKRELEYRYSARLVS